MGKRMKTFLFILLMCLTLGRIDGQTVESDKSLIMSSPNVPKTYFNSRLIRNRKNGFVSVDDEKGNDARARRNSLTYPSKTLTNALRLSKDGDDIYLGIGDYYVGSSLTLSNRNLIGRDLALTRILGGANGSSIIIGLASSIYISDVCIESTNKTGQFVFNIQTIGSAPKDIILDRIKVVGDSDCISIGGGTAKTILTIFDSYFYSHYDAVICSSLNTNSVYRLFNTSIFVSKDEVLFGGIIRGLAAINTRVEVSNCLIVALNGNVNTFGVYGKNSEIFLNSTEINAYSPFGIYNNLYLDGGSAYTNGVRVIFEGQ
jgi:hypothetical protein